MTLVYRPVKESDIPELRHFAIRTMVEKFGHMYKKEDLDAHLAEDYSEAYHREALKNSKITFVTDNDKIIGYAKWGAMKLPVQEPVEPNGEIHRFYVDGAYRGQGIGKKLMGEMMDDMADKAAIYLSVFSENEGAHRFYQRWGFSKYGEYKYMVGNHADHEFIYQFIR